MVTNEFDSELVQVKILFEKLPLLALCMDAQGRVEYVSNLLLKTLGLERDEALGRKCSELFNNSSRLKVEIIFEQIEKHGSCEGINSQFRTKSGQILDVELSATAVTDKEGQLLRVFAILDNNTARVAVQQKNNQLTERLNLALDASKIGIWEWKIIEDELHWEDQMYEVYGLNKEKFPYAAEAWEKVIHPEEIERVLEEVQRAIRGEVDFDTEFRVIDSQGKTRYIRARGIVTRDSQGRPQRMIGANWDNTKERMLIEELKSEQVKMLHAARLASVGEMAAGIAHEINNPLMVIKTKIEVVRQLLEKNELNRDQHKEIAAKVDSMVNRIASIVTGLKNFSRRGFSPSLEDCSIGKILDESLDFFMAKLATEGIQLNIEEVDRNLTVKTQPLLLSQVVLNLIQNARDAIIDQPNPWIRIATIKTSENLEIRVMDSGLGIPQEKQSEIFKSFYTTKGAGRGTGLGLSLSKNIVEGLNGKLFIDSSCSHTCFVIQL